MLVFLIDALGYEIVGRGGFLDELIPVGTRRPVKSILGYSAAAIPSLFTGKKPNEHGHWGMYRRDPAGSVFRRYRGWLRFAGRVPRGQWRVRRWLSGQLRRDGVSGYFSLYEVPLDLLPEFTLAESRNIYRPGGFERVASLFDVVHASPLRARVWDWSSPSDVSFAEMKEAAEAGGYDFLFLYTAGLDEIMHMHGPDGEPARRWLAEHERKILDIVAAARRGGRTARVRLFGDHGMARIHESIDLIGVLRALPVKARKDYLVFVDSTMARFWFHSDRARDVVRGALSSLSAGRFLTREELIEHGVYFADHAYGEEIFLCDPGWLVLPSFMGRNRLLGMHGYHPADKDSDTTWLASPASDEAPRSILGIAPLLLEEMGLGGRLP